MTSAAKQQARQYYRAAFGEGTAWFFEARRDDCPLCGSRSLELRLVSPDVFQRKPGEFRLERCRDCGHIFQNPRLSSAGLALYYRDVYDGLGARNADRMFGLVKRSHEQRAEMIRPYANPRSWLDVGTGYGHFCRVAKESWPETRFAGLDLGQGVRKARRRGWIEEAHHGLFPDLGDGLTGRYDVISMFHYLEHTVDPLRELQVAGKVLGSGGHLLLELPDPECVLGRLLGRYWFPWFQPQHLHMISLDNVRKLLVAAGFSVVAVERREADGGSDLLPAGLLLLSGFGPDPARPWAPKPPTVVDYARRAIALALMVPVLPVAYLLDKTLRHLIPGRGNAFRLLAVKD